MPVLRVVMKVAQWILVLAMPVVNYVCWPAILLVRLSDSGYLAGRFINIVWLAPLLTINTVGFIAVSDDQDWHLLRRWTLGLHLAALMPSWPRQFGLQFGVEHGMTHVE